MDPAGRRPWTSDEVTSFLLESPSPPWSPSPCPVNFVGMQYEVSNLLVDELPNPQQQCPLGTDYLQDQPEPGGGGEDNGPSMVHEQIQQVTPVSNHAGAVLVVEQGTNAVVPSPQLPFSVPSLSPSTAFDDSLYGLIPMMEHHDHWSAEQMTLSPMVEQCITVDELPCSQPMSDLPKVQMGGDWENNNLLLVDDELPCLQPTNDLPDFQTGGGWEDNNLMLVDDLMVLDELPYPPQQLPLLTNDLGDQPACGWEDIDPLLVDEQIQQVTPAFSSPTLAMIPGLAESNHATTSEPMGAQGSARVAGSTISMPRDQDDMLSGAHSQRGRAKERPPRATKRQGHPRPVSQVEDDKFYGMVQDLVGQLGKLIGRMIKEEEDRSVVWRHFWRTEPCKYCSSMNVICKHCKHVIGRYPSTFERRFPVNITKMLNHLKNHDNIDPLASTKVSKQTQPSSCSQALQIREIVENPMPSNENEARQNKTGLIERDNSNCATEAPVDTQGTNAVAMSFPQPQHQLPIDLDDPASGSGGNLPWPSDEKMDSCVERCFRCKGGREIFSFPWPHWRVDYSCPRSSWADLMIRLSESSYGSSSTAKSTRNGFRLQTYRKETERQKAYKGFKLVKVAMQSSAAWMHVSANPYVDPNGIMVATTSTTIGTSHLTVCGGNFGPWKGSFGCQSFDWLILRDILFSLGFRKRFAKGFVIYMLAKLAGSHLRLMSPHYSSSSNRTPRSSPLRIGDGSERGNKDDTNDNVEPGDVSGKKKRKLGARRSIVWKHFTEKVDSKGYTDGKATCKHCRQEYQADTATDGTSRLRRHLESEHPKELAGSS